MNVAGVHMKVDNSCISPYNWVDDDDDNVYRAVMNWFLEKKRMYLKCYVKFIWKNVILSNIFLIFDFLKNLNHFVTA